jgi:hypothetical protein
MRCCSILSKSRITVSDSENKKLDLSTMLYLATVLTVIASFFTPELVTFSFVLIGYVVFRSLVQRWNLGLERHPQLITTPTVDEMRLIPWESLSTQKQRVASEIQSLGVEIIGWETTPIEYLQTIFQFLNNEKKSSLFN